jgi:biotin synthase
LMSVEAVVEAGVWRKSEARPAFCMSAAWRGPKDRDLQRILEIVSAVRTPGIETCATLRLLRQRQADRLRERNAVPQSFILRDRGG